MSLGITKFSNLRARKNTGINSALDAQVKCKECNMAYVDEKRLMEHSVECAKSKEVVAVEPTPTPVAQPVMPKEMVEAVSSIAESLKGISTFLAGQTLPQVLESYSIMTCLGQIMNGLTANQGRVGLDARTIKQDAVDGTHRILAAFDHLRDTFEQRKNGERDPNIVDPEEAFLKWKKEQSAE